MSEKKSRAASRRSLWSWAFYDFANTIFSAIVLTAYFPLYLTEVAGRNVHLGAATTGAMILAATVIPFLGALSDRTGKTKAYLIRSTLLAIFFLFLLSFFRQPFVLIVIFLAACFFYYASHVFYNSLLPVAAPDHQHGFASGLGTGLGYLGVLCILPVAHAVDQALGRSSVFAVAAFFFLAASLPLFLFVPERPAAGRPVKFSAALWQQEWQRLFQLFRTLPSNKPLLFFFLGHFFVVDALNTMIFWFLVFARELYHPAQNELMLFFAAVNAWAFVAGIAAGWLTDRIGAFRLLVICGGLLVATLVALMLSASFPVFVAASLTGGATALAGIWTSGRKVLIEFAPREQIGGYFGIFGLTTKASVLGSLLFSIVADVAGFRAGLWMLILPALAGTVLLIASGACRKRGG